MATADDARIAQTIIEQLGGSQFVAMVGAKQIAFGHRSVQFGIGGNAKGVNKVVIRLNAMDTYDVEYWKIRNAEQTQIASSEGIYADQLVVDFERETGMYTRIG